MNMIQSMRSQLLEFVYLYLKSFGLNDFEIQHYDDFYSVARVCIKDTNIEKYHNFVYVVQPDGCKTLLPNYIFTLNVPVRIKYIIE